MKNIISLSIAFFALGAIASTPLDHNGTYKGEGTWKNPAGKTGKYKVTTTIEGKKITDTYQFGEHEMTFTTTIKMSNTGFFRLLDGKNRPVGHGYCFKTWCHMNMPRVRTEVNIYLDEKSNSLYRMGSKIVEDRPVAWVESLKK